MSKTIWIKARRGYFYFSLDKNNTKPFDTVKGTLKGIYFGKDEYKGEVFDVIYLNFLSEQGEVALSLRCDTTYVLNLMGFLCNVDTDKELEIIISPSKVKEFESSAIFIKQDGEFLKSKFSKGNGYELPKWESVKVGGKTIWDKSKAVDQAIEYTKEFVVSKLKGGSVGGTEMPDFRAEDFGFGEVEIPTNEKEQPPVPTFKIPNETENVGGIDLEKYKL